MNSPYDYLNPNQSLMMKYPNYASVPTMNQTFQNWTNGSGSLGKYSAPASSWTDIFSDWSLPDFLSKDAMFGKVDPKTKAWEPGWANGALDTGSNLMQSWLGLKQYGLMKDSLAMQEDQFNKNYAAQKNLNNSQLMDRQRLRVMQDPANAISVADYMNQYGVK